MNPQARASRAPRDREARAVRADGRHLLARQNVEVRHDSEASQGLRSSGFVPKSRGFRVAMRPFTGDCRSFGKIGELEKECCMSNADPARRFTRRASAREGLADRLLELVGRIPPSRVSAHANAPARARSIARGAAIRTAATAGSLALPPGAIGWLTIAPELYAVWKMQRQMVADIAGVYGRTDLLSREQMLYCLFGHTAAGAFRDVVIRAGERYLIRRAPLSTLYAIANKITLRLAQRSATRLVSRWVPVAGALGVAGYVYMDTGKVADTAIALFEGDAVIEGEAEVVKKPVRRAAKRAAAPRSSRKKAPAGTG